MQGNPTCLWTLHSGLVAAAILVGSISPAHGDVIFSNIVDGNGSTLLFDVTTTAPDPGNGNKLNIGLNSFTANGASMATTSAVDTLSMTIDAPAGFFITSVDYTEGGTGTTTQGVATATGSMVADGIPTVFVTQMFAPNSSSSWTISPATTNISNKTSISVSITNSLFAFAFTPNDTAQISKTSAMLTVGITPVPEPGTWAISMLGLAAACLATRRRRAI